VTARLPPWPPSVAKPTGCPHVEDTRAHSVHTSSVAHSGTLSTRPAKSFALNAVVFVAFVPKSTAKVNGSVMLRLAFVETWAAHMSGHEKL